VEDEMVEKVIGFIPLFTILKPLFLPFLTILIKKFQFYFSFEEI